MLIWIEIELHSNDYTYYDIAQSEWLNFTDFKTKNWLKIKMSEEHYPHTIEYNFEPKEFTNKYIDKVVNFINLQIQKYSLRINWNQPAYVWTHIHIFDLKYRKIWVDAMLQTTMSFIDKKYRWLDPRAKERLFLSHQLWRNYSYTRWDEYLDTLSEHWRDMSFTDYNQNDKKYNPCIISNRSNKGKPRSIEIRIIPNEIMLNWEIKELLQNIKDFNLSTCNVDGVLESWINN